MCTYISIHHDYSLNLIYLFNLMQYLLVFNTPYLLLKKYINIVCVCVFVLVYFNFIREKLCIKCLRFKNKLSFLDLIAIKLGNFCVRIEHLKVS